MRLLFTIYILIGLSISLISQNTDDALRYSYLTPSGTARVVGAGSSFGSLGGDIGVANINVAGLAEFRSREISVSGIFVNPNATNTFNGQQVGQTSDGREVKFDNLGFVSHKKPLGSKLKTSNWFVGLQNIADFDELFSYRATSVGSITERFADDLNFELENGGSSNNLNPFDALLAFRSEAIRIAEPFNFAYTDLSVLEIDPVFGDTIAIDNLTDLQTNKQEIIDRRGGINEFQVAWAGKLNSGLNLGVGLGVPFVSYTENRFYQEDGVGNTGFQTLNFDQSLTTSGTGFNLKLGVGYNIKKKYRLALAFQSPTFYRLADTFTTTFLYSCDSCGAPNLQRSPNGEFDYRLRTPMRITASIGSLLIIKEVRGFFNIDVHYIDLTQNSFNFTASQFSTPADEEAQDFENQIIDEDLGSGFNINVGGELGYKKLRGRLGVATQFRPFRNELGNVLTLAGGLGYRANRIYVDAAIQFRTEEEGYVPYLALTEERDLELLNEVSLTRIILTVGFKI